jgi:hypothetical protein
VRRRETGPLDWLFTGGISHESIASQEDCQP